MSGHYKVGPASYRVGRGMLWWLLGYVMIPVCEKTGTIIISLLKRARASPVGINSIYVYERGAIEPPPIKMRL